MGVLCYQREVKNKPEGGICGKEGKDREAQSGSERIK